MLICPTTMNGLETASCLLKGRGHGETNVTPINERSVRRHAFYYKSSLTFISICTRSIQTQKENPASAEWWHVWSTSIKHIQHNLFFFLFSLIAVSLMPNNDRKLTRAESNSLKLWSFILKIDIQIINQHDHIYYLPC